MSNEKALAIIPRTVDEVRSLASQFAKSSLLPDALRGKEADVFVSIMAGQELGLPPMAALRGVHVVKGRPILSADTMVGVVLGRGVAEYFICTDETASSVTYETKRIGAPKAQRCTWTLEDAKRAGLDGDNWRKYPRAMLKARCKAMLARDVYPDVLAGCYDTDEAREFDGGRSEPRPAPEKPEADDAEIVEETKAPNLDQIADELITRISAAEELSALEGLQESFKPLLKGTPQRKRAADAYAAQRRHLQSPSNGAAETAS